MTTAIVLGGGLGTRLRDAVPDLPKPMAPINGRPFLDYLIEYWRGQGVRRFILSVGYRRDAIIDYFGDHYRDAAIDYAVEDTPLGTGGGVLLAARNIAAGERFLLLNGDTFFAVDFERLMRCAQRNDADCCFSMFRSNTEGRYMAMEVADDGCIRSLKSGKAGVGSLANGGVYYLRRCALQEERFTLRANWSLEDDIFPAALAAGRRLIGVEFLGGFIDIGVPEDYARAGQVLDEPASR
ncbi:sugar phosphate nucleotidyltransferase [Methylomonas sp. SURF-2]|uniref:Sugar phosphate nucleotidyltransferase n=1 Tax=Methylomonas subterranea TaxID=2952225 RepID=A0ABT1TAJ8_9GAMM|nr:sugar phosphate nucleotidyltransferase [Methylomonas sp. SURF-2]